MHRPDSVSRGGVAYSRLCVAIIIHKITVSLRINEDYILLYKNYRWGVKSRVLTKTNKHKSAEKIRYTFHNLLYLCIDEKSVEKYCSCAMPGTIGGAWQHKA